MMTRRIPLASDLNRWHLGCVRGVLAALIALSVVLTLFNCGCCTCADGDEDFLMVSVTQTGSDVPGRPGPLSIAPHCCHCLAHAMTVAPQVDAVATEYIANPYRLAAAPVPEAADLTSPFEPPRA
jgi:hypothetical protein